MESYVLFLWEFKSLLSHNFKEQFEIYEES